MLRRVAYVALLLLPLVVLAVLFKGQGVKTALLNKLFPGSVTVDHPRVESSDPGEDAANVPVDAHVVAEVVLPNPGHVVDAATVNSGSVRLIRQGDEHEVPAYVNTSAAGDVIVLKPLELLEPNTKYKFEVLPALKDTSGASFTRYAIRFTTASNVPAGTFAAAFEQVPLPPTAGRAFLSLAIGPDGRLYAGTRNGTIHCFELLPDGQVGSARVITAVREGSGADRLITGLCFDPASTPEAPVLWVSHGQASLTSADEWTGRVGRLRGRDLSQYDDVVVGLPRAMRDHLNNQLVFGPDGALYLSQASLTGMGDADPSWGDRPERLLSAAVLRLDVQALASIPLDVRTPDGGGSYDPFAADAPLTLHATGVRNAFDLLWHSNGRLYAPVNGSAAGGNAPGWFGDEHPRRIDADRGALSGDGVPALHNIRTAGPDYLALIEPGRYYGHPNPARGEYVMNGGNPTTNTDPYEMPAYPVGTAPDRNWARPAFHFGKSLAPVGICEYRAVNGQADALNGAMLVARYGGGKDLVALIPAADGSIREAVAGIQGLTQFADPIDVVQHPVTGHLYVAEYGGERITLLRPTAGTSTRVFRQVFERRHE